MKSIRLILFGIFLLLFFGVIFQSFQNHHWNTTNVFHFDRLVFLSVSDDKTGQPKDSLKEMEKEFFFTVLGGLISGAIGLLTGWILARKQSRDAQKTEIESCKRDCYTVIDRIVLDASRKYELGLFYNSTKRRLEECIFVLAARLKGKDRIKIHKIWDEYDQLEFSVEVVNAYHSPVEPAPNLEIYAKDQKAFLAILNKIRAEIEKI